MYLAYFQSRFLEAKVGLKSFDRHINMDAKILRRCMNTSFGLRILWAKRKRINHDRY